MKTYTFNGRTFQQRNPSLAVENRWLEFAVNEDGSFNRAAVRDLTRDEEAVNWFMERLMGGDHDGIDWYNADGAQEVIGEVIADFFSQWIAKVNAAMATPPDGSEGQPSSQSAKGKVARKKTAS